MTVCDLAWRKPGGRQDQRVRQPHQFYEGPVYEGQEFLEQHNLVPSMSRRRACWDNAVVESFLNLLKRARIRRDKFQTHEETRRDVFDYIEFL